MRNMKKNKHFPNGIAVVSLITAGLALTSTKPQAHGHQHADIFGRIVHKAKASSGSSLNLTNLGAADGKLFCTVRSRGSILISPPEPVAILPTTTGISCGPNYFGGDCDSTNVTHQSSPFTDPTPIPQSQLQALKVQDGQLAGLSSRRRKGYRSSHLSAKDEASPASELGPASTSTISAKTSGTYWLD